MLILTCTVIIFFSICLIEPTLQNCPSESIVRLFTLTDFTCNHLNPPRTYLPNRTHTTNIFPNEAIIDLIIHSLHFLLAPTPDLLTQSTSHWKCLSAIAATFSTLSKFHCIISRLILFQLKQLLIHETSQSYNFCFSIEAGKI